MPGRLGALRAEDAVDVIGPVAHRAVGEADALVLASLTASDGDRVATAMSRGQRVERVEGAQGALLLMSGLLLLLRRVALERTARSASDVAEGVDGRRGRDRLNAAVASGEVGGRHGSERVGQLREDGERLLSLEEQLALLALKLLDLLLKSNLRRARES